MSDTERLNLIEHYKWRVSLWELGGWQVNGVFGVARAVTLRDAIDAAMAEQVKWATASTFSQEQR